MLFKANYTMLLVSPSHFRPHTSFLLTESKPSTPLLRSQRNIPVPISLFIDSTTIAVLKRFVSRIEVIALATALMLTNPVLEVLRYAVLPVATFGGDDLVDSRAL
jgi:hypothetical protein